MSVVKLLVLSILMVLLSFFSSKYMGEPTSHTKYEVGDKYANKDAPYQLYVPEDGQMVRLEFKGTAPMNQWQSFDMEVFSADEKYLFSYQDEVWSESGRDSDGRWTERRVHAYFDIRFPKRGDYFIYLTDSSSSRKLDIRYTFRAVPINGNAQAFKPLMWIFIAIGIVCFIILSHRFEQESQKPMRVPDRHGLKPEKKKSNSWGYFFLGAFGIWAVVLFIATDEDDDIDSSVYYFSQSHKHKQIYVDRSLRQQSLSGPSFRSGSGKGGK